MKIKGLWGKVTENAAEALFPSGIYCISCGSMIDRDRTYALCDSCAAKLHWINGRSCEKCGKALADTYRGRVCYDCMAEEHDFTRGFSCMTYGLMERNMILSFKYGDKGYMGRHFGDIMYDRLTCEDIEADVVIPVPLHRKRQQKRGYNQTEIMADRLSYLMKIKLDTKSLIKVRETRPLSGMNIADMAMAVESAFEVREGRREALYGKNVLLVDDIYTTGATADACSRAVLAGGAKNVYVISLASGGNRRHDEDNTP